MVGDHTLILCNDDYDTNLNPKPCDVLYFISCHSEMYKLYTNNKNLDKSLITAWRVKISLLPKEALS